METANAGDYVKVKLAIKEIEGIVLESYDKDILLLKLNSGYNIGIPKENIHGLEIVKSFTPSLIPKAPKSVKGLPTIALVITGGTIASKVDYSTGGVKPLTSVEEFAKAYPNIFQKYTIKKIETPFMTFSENMSPEHWIELAKTITLLLEDKEIQGVIVTHGTDTLHYTGAALSFFIKNLNKPIVLTYSQRSVDRASSDAQLNLECAAQFALSDCAEVVLVGHANENDEYCYALRATKVRKLHSSRRDAFKPVNTQALAKVWPNKTEFILQRRPRNDLVPQLDAAYNSKVGLIKFYPGQDPSILDFYQVQGYKGIVLETLGLGQVAASEAKESWIPAIKKAIKAGITIVAVPQTIYGALNPQVYSSGRELEKTGVIFLKDMLSETALVKLGWILAHKEFKGEKIKDKLLENTSFEYNELLTE